MDLYPSSHEPCSLVSFNISASAKPLYILSCMAKAVLRMFQRDRDSENVRVVDLCGSPDGSGRSGSGLIRAWASLRWQVGADLMLDAASGASSPSVAAFQASVNFW